jgi:hypothetical protein
MNTFTGPHRVVLLAALSALPLVSSADDALADSSPFSCDPIVARTCTLTVSPAGGAGATLTAPAPSFQARMDGTGFDIRGDVRLGGSLAPVPGTSLEGAMLYEASLVAEYANPAAPEEGFRRLRGTALMRNVAAAGADPGFGILTLGAEEEFRVDVGLELGSVLHAELDIQHLNPNRPCEGRLPGDDGFRECPYWVFRVVDERSIGAGFGGTDVGLNMTASSSESQNVTFLMDPEDFFTYVGYTSGSMDSVTLKIEPTAGDKEPGESLMNNDNGIGFSQSGYIPFSPRTRYGIESEIDALGAEFSGHLVVDKSDIPIGPGVFMDGSAVFRFPLDELTGDATFDNHWQSGGNGDVKLTVPLYKAVKWEMALGEATAGAKLTSTRQHIYASGDLNKDFPWKPEGLPLSLDYRNNYQVAAVLVNNVDPDTAIPYVDLGESFVQMEGEYLLDLGLGNPSSEFGYEIRSRGYLRADATHGIEFWGTIGQGASATMLHPLIQADADATLALTLDPARPDSARMEMVGEFSVGGETFSQQARLVVTPKEGYLGAPLSFDPDLILKAYNDIQAATREAEAEVNKLTGEIERQRAIVRAERAQQQAAVDSAWRDVDWAQAQVNKINYEISRHYSNINYYKGRIKSWYNWYKKQPWYKKPGAYATYLAKAAYYNSLIGAQYAAIGAEKAALAVATAALDVAKGVLETAKAALVITPVDLDPRIGPVIIARDVALGVLNALQQAMPEIPDIPGTIRATAGFRFDASGMTPETRATYCDGGSCIEIRGGSYDRAAGRACITLPTMDERRVCTAIPAEPV